ncbi:MAG: hypothetical protein IJC29_02765 [Clostridia bacterium]|nr:hypothetical protein [Clostridia bacterium]
MKFRRNIKEEKLFHKVALFSLIAEIVLLTIYFITFNEELVRFILLLLFVFPLYFLLVHLLRKSFVEFQEDKIILINGNGINIVININEIEKILIPSSKALESKMKANAIIIKRIGVNNIISYSSEIENYIKNNYKIDVEYYDNYTQAIK